MKRKSVLFLVLICCVIGSAFCESEEYFCYHGEVVNEEGKPVAGALIKIYDIPKKTIMPSDATLERTIRSDMQGHFSFARKKNHEESIYSSFAIIQTGIYPDYYLYYGYLISKPQVVLPSEKGEISGTVVDSDGNPVSGAAVYACMARPYYFAISNVPELTCQTDENGKFSFDSFSYKTKVDFYVTKEGYTGTCTFLTNRKPTGQYKNDNHNIQIVIKKPGLISGQLIRADSGKAMSGEKVSIVRNQKKGYLYTRSPWSPIEVVQTLNPNDSQTLLTDSNGRFTAENLFPGKYTVFHHNYTKGLFTPKIAVQVEEASRNEVKIESISGENVILDSTLEGGCIEDHELKVTIRREKETGKTGYTYFWDNPTLGSLDSKGSYHFKVPPGKYKVNAVSRTVKLQDHNILIDVPSQRYPALSMAVKDINNICLKGYCLDEKNNRIANTKVYLLSDPTNVVYSDAKGNFALPFRHEENKKYFLNNYEKIKKRDRNFSEVEVYYSTVEDLDPQNWESRETYLVAENADQSLSLIYDLYGYSSMKRSIEFNDRTSRQLKLQTAYTVKGLAVDEKLTPVKGARVELRMQDQMGDTYNVIRNVLTDKNGEFTLDCISYNKSYTVVVTNSSGGCRMKSFGKPINSEGEFVYFRERSKFLHLGDFVVTGNHYNVSGIVVDLLGRPVSEAKVYLKSPNQGIDYRVIKTGKDGRFKFGDLSFVKVQLSAKADEIRSRSFEIIPGDNDVRIVLGGTVPDEKVAGKPVSGAEVEIEFVDKRSRAPITFPKARVIIQPENACGFEMKFNKEGKVRFLTVAGKHNVQLTDVGGKYRYSRKEFVTELNQSYKLRYELVPK